MTTLAKLILGGMGALRPLPAKGHAAPSIPLPAPRREGGMALMQALSERRSSREFASTTLPPQLLSDLLWATCGTNRKDGMRTAPSALNAQQVWVLAALPNGAYRYDPEVHALELVAGSDVRRTTGYQDFVDDAPLDLVFVADHRLLSAVPLTQREPFDWVTAGAMAQNVYLFAAANGLSTVLRAWIDREAIAKALGLSMEEHVLLSQTVGYPKP
jgi:nitroreductase